MLVDVTCRLLLLLKSLFPSLVLTALMVAAILAVMKPIASPLLRLAAGIPAGIAVYIGLAILTGAQPYKLMLSLARPYWKGLARKK